MDNGQTLFSCRGTHKSKNHPTDPLKDHVTFYKCVWGTREFDKIKLYPNKHILKTINVEYWELKPVEEISKPDEPEPKNE